MARINIAQFRKEILSTLDKNKIDKEAYNFAKSRFQERKEELIHAFKEDDITKEILSGPDGGDRTGATRGVGSLYGFIGFEPGQAEEDIQNIEQVLETEVSLRPTTRIDRNNLRWTFGVYVPAQSTLFAATPMPWETGLSWLRSLELAGFSNLNHYIYKVGYGRSKGGLQIKHEYRPIAFTPIPYVFNLLENFKRGFN